MSKEDELIADRAAKRALLVRDGLGYPYRYDRTHFAGDLAKRHAAVGPNTTIGERVRVAGRVLALRRLGAITFARVQDGSGAIQILFKQDLPRYDSLKLLDIGDFVGVEGELITTKTGELTVESRDYTHLAKALRPLPDKWHGLKDIEARYRQRHLDLVMNGEARVVFTKRARMIAAMRRHLDEHCFLEVETPVLQPIYGGANARPFSTTHHDMKMTMYLKISPELYLKRLLIGGFEKVYELNKCFRNESMDTTHNPEFTSIEIYQAYADYTDMMRLTEELFAAAARAANGTTACTFDGKAFDVKPPWPRVTMKDAIKQHAGVDVDALSDSELFQLRTTYNLEVKGDLTRGAVIAALFDELVEDKLVAPVHIIDHPAETTPLCKAHRTQKGLIERFESFCCGMEVSNAYSELNDPVVQRQLLEEQAKQLRAGAAEAHPMDEDFIRAMEHGMPPAGGLGIGIDRMVMLLTGNTSIRDVILFPAMKPELADMPAQHPSLTPSPSLPHTKPSPKQVAAKSSGQKPTDNQPARSQPSKHTK